MNSLKSINKCIEWEGATHLLNLEIKGSDEICMAILNGLLDHNTNTINMGGNNFKINWYRIKDTDTFYACINKPENDIIINNYTRQLLIKIVNNLNYIVGIKDCEISYIITKTTNVIYSIKGCDYC